MGWCRIFIDMIIRKRYSSILEAMEKMTEEGIGRLLVMEKDTLVGIMSRSSIMDIE